MRKLRNLQSGQVALIMVLIVTIISAIVVSLAGRVTSESRVQNIFTDSSRAFLAAQSGIEDALKKQSSVPATEINGNSYAVGLTEVGGSEMVSELMLSGTTMEIVLTGSVNLTGIKVYWSMTDTDKSSVLVSIVNPATMRDFAYDTEGKNGFTMAGAGGVFAGVNYTYKTDEIGILSGDSLLRVTVYGGSSKVAVEPIGGNFPTQILKYKSSGSAGTGDKKVVYGLEYEESKAKKLPEIFDYALFSYGTIIQ